MDTEDKLRFDYEQTHELIRMFTDIRFKLLAFVPTLTGAAVALLSGVDNRATTLMLGLLGLFVTLGIVSYEMRNTVLYDAAIHRAKCLELRLGLPLFTQGKQWAEYSTKGLPGRCCFEVRSCSSNCTGGRSRKSLR